MRRLLIVLVAAAALVIGCDAIDNTGGYAIKDGYLCDVVTDECEVLP